MAIYLSVTPKQHTILHKHISNRKYTTKIKKNKNLTESHYIIVSHRHSITVLLIKTVYMKYLMQLTDKFKLLSRY